MVTWLGEISEDQVKKEQVQLCVRMELHQQKKAVGEEVSFSTLMDNRCALVRTGLTLKHPVPPAIKHNGNCSNKEKSAPG